MNYPNNQMNQGNQKPDAELRKVELYFEGRLMFPKLVNPEANKNNPNGRKTYSAVIVFPMQLTDMNRKSVEHFNQLKQQFKQIWCPMVPEHAYTKALKNIQECPVQENSGKPHPEFYQGSFWINANSGEDRKPQILKKVNGQLREVDANDPDLYFGQKVIACVTLYPIGTDPNNPQSRKGLSANLKGILIVGGGERIEASGQTFDGAQAFANFANATADFQSGNVNHFSGFDQGNGYNPGQSQGNAPVQTASNPYAQSAQNQQGGFGMGGQPPAQTAYPSSNPYSQPNPNQGQQANNPYAQPNQGQQANNPYAQPNQGQNNPYGNGGFNGNGNNNLY